MKGLRLKANHTILGNNAIRVGTSISMNVLDSFFDAIYDFYCAFQTAVFDLQRIGHWRSEFQHTGQFRPRTNFYLILQKCN